MWPLVLLVTAGVALWAVSAHAEAAAAHARVLALQGAAGGGAQWNVLAPDATGVLTVPAGAYFAMSVSSASPQAPLFVKSVNDALSANLIQVNQYGPGQTPPTWPDVSMDPSANAPNYYRVIGQVLSGAPLLLSSGMFGPAGSFPVRVFTSPTRPAVALSI